MSFNRLILKLVEIALGIPPKKKSLDVSSVNLKDPRKGGDLLIQALQKLPESLKKKLRAADFRLSINTHRSRSKHTLPKLRVT